MSRTILHCDLNGFYAAVECLFRPELLRVPMAVAGNPEHRHGIILAKNELAKACHVQTAETIWQALRKCPNLILVPPRHEEYDKYSKLVSEIYARYTDLIEPFGIDESWLDVTGVEKLFGSGEEIATALRRDVREELGLTISVGVSFNKIFAKLGSDYKKPDATTVITEANYREILYPLPVGDLLYVGKAAVATLAKLSIRTIGDLAASNRKLVIAHLGKMGEQIHDYANALDDSPVRPANEGRDLKSVGNGLTFRRNLVGWSDIKTGLASLADEVGGRMRRHGVKCLVVSVLIKNPEFRSISRQKTLERPTHLTRELLEAAMELMHSGWDPTQPIRMLTLTASHLVTEEEPEQLSLFSQVDGKDREKQERLDAAMDTIRDKYGRSSIALGGVLHNDMGIEN